MPAGTHKLCMTLYGEVRACYYLGGSNARMLHDAAEALEKNRRRVNELQAKLAAEREAVVQHIRHYAARLNEAGKARERDLLYGLADEIMRREHIMRGEHRENVQ